jgi:hypothetical protein
VSEDEALEQHILADASGFDEPAGSPTTKDKTYN